MILYLCRFILRLFRHKPHRHPIHAPTQHHTQPSQLMLHCQHMNIYIISAFFFSIFLYFGMTFIYASIVWLVVSNITTTYTDIIIIRFWFLHHGNYRIRAYRTNYPINYSINYPINTTNSTTCLPPTLQLLLYTLRHATTGVTSKS